MFNDCFLFLGIKVGPLLPSESPAVGLSGPVRLLFVVSVPVQDLLLKFCFCPLPPTPRTLSPEACY